MTARMGLLRLHRAGLIELPAPSGRNGNGRPLVHGPAAWPEPMPAAGTVEQLSGLRLEAVTDKRASRLWNGLIDRYHYLGLNWRPGSIWRISGRSQQHTLLNDAKVSRVTGSILDLLVNTGILSLFKPVLGLQP